VVADGFSIYTVTRELGEGGVGRVYEAVHQPSGRVVAIKTLRSTHGDSVSQRLLLDEAAAAAQIAHAGIVELLDVGRDDRGGMFLVMELVRGSSLESWSQSFPGLATVLRAACEILSALSVAHAQGIVHGDLKPANVLLTERGHVKLTDFGIAHMIDPLKKSARRGVQGTPYYMAPEQLVDVDSIAPPTDLYALGVMLYELLTGREPYASSGSLVDIAARKLHSVQPFVPRRDLPVPAELASLVMDLLTPDPRMRPRFAAHVRRALEAIAARSPNEPIDDAVTAASSTRTWVQTPLVAAPTISSADALPVSGSTRSLPFSLPAGVGLTADVALHRLRPLPLVGRDAQVARLRLLVGDVVAGRGARGMVVSGRAGEGKTRLVRHGLAEVEREGTMAFAAASFDETIANAQVGLRAGIQRLLGEPHASLGDTLAGSWRWLTTVAQPGVDFARMHEWLSPGARARDVDASAEIAAMCVLAASRVHPIYLWLDDVAWSRDGAMELMVQLLEANAARVFVVGTLRSGTAEHPAVRDWLLRLARAGAAFEMLPPLSASDRVALFEAAGPLAPEVASKLGAMIEEPTLVLVEAVRTWIDEGLLVPSDGGYVLREGADENDLVAQARGSVLRGRIMKLLASFGDDAPHAERVVCHAALLGLRFEERVLRACGSAWVDRVLDRALLSGLLRVDHTGGGLAGGGRGAYRFEHRMFLDVIVDLCAARADAREIFRATADALSTTYSRRNVDTGIATATLYRSGGDPESAADCISHAIRAQCRASAFDAADRALALFASWNEADALPDAHVRRGMLERARGARAYFALDYPTATAHAERALRIFEACGARVHAHMTLFDLSSNFFYQDRFADAERCVQFVHEPDVATDVLSRAHHRLSELAAMRGDLPRAIAHQLRSTAAASLADDRAFESVALATLAELQCAAGNVDAAVEAAERERAIAESFGDRLLRADVDRVASCIDAARGYYAAARAKTTARALEMTRRNDAWHVSAELALVLLCSAGLNDLDVLERDARAFVDAYTKVPHDEAFTWFAVRAAQKHMINNGHLALAARVGQVLDARFAQIAAAFGDADPITEDEGRPKDAATRASSR